jgi:endonuclease/exonuclease/phosphatase family metal-dependent hydrolase
METTPTFYHQRNLSKPYHIDYVFTGNGVKEGTLEIGMANIWLEWSDHMPLSLSL